MVQRNAGKRITVDELLMQAWPPEQRVHVGSWLARLDAGVTRRANSVLPLGEGAQPDSRQLDDWLGRTVRLYRDRGLTPWLQVTDRAWPAGLERALAARGWETSIDRTLILSGALPAADTASVRLDDHPHRAWVDTWWRVDPRGDAVALSALLRLFDRIASPKAFARVLDADDRCIATALGVVADSTLILECVATLPESRRCGMARRALSALAAWARSLGADRALLSVQETNAPARALYTSMQLVECGAYAYARFKGGSATEC
jgi:GNAT superfamily N-acetyltransferase